jgi:surface polysaccharide O-acyltransferase-like enzyme
MVLAGLARWTPASVRSTLWRIGSAMLSGTRLLWLPVVLLALTRMTMLDRFGSTHALFDDWYNHAQYGLVFVMGLLFAHNGSVWSRLERARWWTLGLSVSSYIALILYFSVYAQENPPAALRMAMRSVWAGFQWWTIAAILGLAQRWRARDSAALRYLTEAVFPVYIFHQTLIILLAIALRPLGWSPVFEGPLLALATLSFSFALFELVRRTPPLRPLFGLASTPRRARSTGAMRASRL